jgi:hypothetical protein
MDASFVTGIEGIGVNPGGISAGPGGTNVLFTHTIWFSGSDIAVNTLGFSTAFDNGGTLALAVQAFDLGDIERTTIDNPDGGVGSYSPSFLNINIAYSREMVPDMIYVGLNSKIVHESIPDASATGIAFDAGVQFHDNTGNFKLGVALRNIGPQMRYQGDGLTVRTQLAGGNANFDNAVQIRSNSFELPSILLIGASYDFNIGGTDTTESMHRITPMGSFYSNAFGQDRFGAGIEYSFRNYFSFRFSQVFEENQWDEGTTRNVYSGQNAGVSFQIPFGQNDDMMFGLDYTYRHTYFYNGTHTVGARMRF